MPVVVIVVIVMRVGIVRVLRILFGLLHHRLAAASQQTFCRLRAALSAVGSGVARGLRRPAVQCFGPVPQDSTQHTAGGTTQPLPGDVGRAGHAR